MRGSAALAPAQREDGRSRIQEARSVAIRGGGGGPIAAEDRGHQPIRTGVGEEVI